MIDKHAWRNEYKRLLIEICGMTKPQAESHFQNSPDFDFGYNPCWYVREEIINGLIKSKT